MIIEDGLVDFDRKVNHRMFSKAKSLPKVEIGDGLSEFDIRKGKIAKHKMPSSRDDLLETPWDLYYYLCEKHGILCELDPFSSAPIFKDEKLVVPTNAKCTYNFTFEMNFDLQLDYTIDGTPFGKKPTGVWINHPHTLHEEVLRYNHQQWLKHDLDMLMIIPANSVRPPYWNKYVGIHEHRGLEVEPLNWINPEQRDKGVTGYINFKKEGEDSEFESRNGYLVLRYFSIKSYKKWISDKYSLIMENYIAT
jgi:hypothetical protein